MHILITYSDGTTETVAVTIETERVSSGRDWIPGHNVECPNRCYFKSDFFECALDEGHETSGTEDDEFDDGFESFTWKLVGSDEEECRKLLSKWLEIIGPSFDVWDFDPETLPADQQAQYEIDSAIWFHFLGNPVKELETLKASSSAPRP